MRIEFKVPGAHIIYECPECKCIDFIQLGGESFACCGCGLFFDDFNTLIEMEGNATYNEYMDKMRDFIDKLFKNDEEESIDDLIDRKLDEAEESKIYRVVANGRGIKGMTIQEKKELLRSNPFDKKHGKKNT